MCVWLTEFDQTVALLLPLMGFPAPYCRRLLDLTDSSVEKVVEKHVQQLLQGMHKRLYTLADL